MSLLKHRELERRVNSQEQTIAAMGNRLDRLVEALEILEERVKQFPPPKRMGNPGRPRRPRAKASA